MASKPWPEITWERAWGRGTVCFFTVAHRTWVLASRDELAHAVARVELGEGVQVLTNLAAGPVRRKR